MKSAPDIVVQIIHIEGPLKGQVQEFLLREITIGRSETCNVSFPKDQMTISRVHAKIVRDGNRFKIIDQSSNGTLINGKFVKEQYIKDGDVLFITEQGPKISFLTRKAEEGETFETPASPPPPVTPQPIENQAPEIPEQAPPEPVPVPHVPPQAPPAHEIPVIETFTSLTIQYGPNLHSFKKLPVTVGRSPECELVIEAASIGNRQALFFFYENSYWIKDLTGRNVVTVNDSPAGIQRELFAEDLILISPEGPKFKFIGSGRLFQVEEEEPVAPEAPEPAEKARESRFPEKAPAENKFKSLIRGILKK